MAQPQPLNLRGTTRSLSPSPYIPPSKFQRLNNLNSNNHQMKHHSSINVSSQPNRIYEENITYSLPAYYTHTPTAATNYYFPTTTTVQPVQAAHFDFGNAGPGAYQGDNNYEQTAQNGFGYNVFPQHHGMQKNGGGLYGFYPMNVSMNYNCATASASHATTPTGAGVGVATDFGVNEKKVKKSKKKDKERLKLSGSKSKRASESSVLYTAEKIREKVAKNLSSVGSTYSNDSGTQEIFEDDSNGSTLVRSPAASRTNSKISLLNRPEPAENEQSFDKQESFMQSKEVESLDEITANADRSWTEVENTILECVVETLVARSNEQKRLTEKSEIWRTCSYHLPKRSPSNCYEQWKILNPEKACCKMIARRHWTFQECKALKDFVDKFGTERWGEIAKRLPGRSSTQCREKWEAKFDPQRVHADWTEEEKTIVLAEQERLGNKWSLIAKKLPGRTRMDVKNFWHCHLREEESQHYVTSASQDSN